MAVDQVRLLYNISRRLNSDLDIDRVLADVLDLTVKQLGASNGSVIIFGQDGQVAHRILARTGIPPEQADAIVTDVLTQGLAGWVVKRQRGAIVSDVLSDARWLNLPGEDPREGSAIAVPLVRSGQVIGVITLRHAEPNHFGDAHLGLLSSIADQASIAVQNARLFYSVQVERARMEAVINGAGDAILVTDRQGWLLLINAAARQAFDLPPESDLEHQFLGDVISNQALHALWEKRNQAAPPPTAEIPVSAGSTFYASLTQVPDVGFVIVMQDITALKDLDRLKDEFISNVSHDLRSPLQLIHAYAGLLLGDNSLTTEQRQYLHGIDRSVRRMSDLTADLLNLAKIRAGVGMDAEPCLLSRIIPRVIERLEALARQKGLRLESQIADDLPPVQANVERMDQVISNLVDNAIKYTLRGKVSVHACADEQQVTVSVSDSGIGLMPHEQAELFTKFYRAKNELTGNIEGTGLGLSIVRSIVEQYGGKVWVTSTWQQGSTFSFSVPRST